MELLIQYFIILLPSICAIIGSLATAVKQMRSLARTDKMVSRTSDVADAAKAAIDNLASGKEVQQILAQNAALLTQLNELAQQTTLLEEELRGIHKLHPEFFAESENESDEEA